MSLQLVVLFLCHSYTSAFSKDDAVSVLGEPEPCFAPPRWEGQVLYHNQETGLLTTGLMSYDETNERIRVVRTTVNAPVQETKEAILRWDEGRFYFVDKTNEKCRVTKPEFEFKRVGIPRSAHFVTENTIGIDNSSLLVYTFGQLYKKHQGHPHIPVNQALGSVSSRKGHPPRRHHDHDIHTWLGSVTADYCVPVSEYIYENDLLSGKHTPEFLVSSIETTNITEGIALVSVFDPPSYCHTDNSTDLDISFEMYRFTLI